MIRRFYQISDRKTKYCPDCKFEKLISEFGKNNGRHDGLTIYCKDHIKLRRIKYKESTKSSRKLAKKNYLKSVKGKQNAKSKRNKLRNEALDKLGKACKFCGEKYYEFLSIDHVNNDGYEDKTHKQTKLKNIIKEKDLEKFQILCYNCNWEKYVLTKLTGIDKESDGKTCPSCLMKRNKFYRNESKVKNGIRNSCSYCISFYSFLKKIKIIEIMGNKCECCGETRPIVLNIDHKNNDGFLRRSEGWGTSIYTKLINGKLNINNYKLLCANCNISKHIGKGKCWHERLI